jgi:hypothetical protein
MTSESILNQFPFLAEKVGWKAFAEAFDKPDCVEKRRLAREAHEGVEPSPEITKLRDLCHHISWQAFWRSPSDEADSLSCGFFLGGYDSCANEGEKIARFVGVAGELAAKVEMMLSDSDEGKRLRDLLFAEIQRQKFLRLPKGERETRMGHEAYLALIGFIRREGRLPSKRELNLEAGRRSRVQKRTNCREPVPHGTVVRGVWRVQSCEWWPGIKALEDPECYRIELVDCRGGMEITWEALRWSENTFSKDVVKPFGFAGLPHHQKS